METPIVFLIFNRPEITRKVFAEIARVKPKRLLVVADGPRSDAEVEKCRSSRAVIELVDWDCEVLTSYSDINLGCKRRVSSGLNWVFDQCEEAIILEDDCLPHPTFFSFCVELLERHRNDDRVMTIGGSNFQFGRDRGSYSYYFSCYTHIWGWATWRSSWKDYDVEMKQWPALRETDWLHTTLGEKAAAKHWKEVFDMAYQGRLDTWDIQWLFACLTKNGLTALPNGNLISNIGFGEDATHTKSDIYGVSRLPTVGVSFPLSHPVDINRDKIADKYMFDNVFAKEVDSPNLYRRLGRMLLASLPDPMRDSIAVLRGKTR